MNHLLIIKEQNKVNNRGDHVIKIFLSTLSIISKKRQRMRVPSSYKVITLTSVHVHFTTLDLDQHTQIPTLR